MVPSSATRVFYFSINVNSGRIADATAGWTAAHELHISLPIAQTPNPRSLIRMPVASGGCGNGSLSVRDPGLIDRNSPHCQSSELS
jgi:hypothetical protein